jgi:zinc transporter 1/2/3
VPLLLACGINGSAPGDYSITFSVTNSAGRRAVVRRAVKVKALCPEGEQRCDDQVGAAQVPAEL